ncbi:hypothetical protein F4782DRAFT_493578 [Xylaria castorea]|nr:hypothetical protein F4782DRAFT_493578 [Xylaria castorea]
MMSEETSSIYRLLKESSKETVMSVKQTRKELQDLKDTIMKSVESLQVNALRHNNDGLKKVSEMLIEVTKVVTTVSKQDWILGKLGFDEMYDREHSIEDAHKQTFRWLLYDSLEDDPKLPDETDGTQRGVPIAHSSEDTAAPEAGLAFRDWLSSGNGIFFISGKAGSGKSTLMKYLANDEFTKKCLESWAGKTSLVFGRFFFWNAGTEMQKSIEGLYRNILSEILRQCPPMMEVAFPRHCNNELNLTDDRLGRSPFRFSELETVFEQLIRNDDIFQRHSICLFIDGLDEYQGDHWKLAILLKDWAETRGVKICVSSRPRNEFIQNFNHPKKHLKLHELTREDIRKLTACELENDERFARMVARDAGYSSLISSVAARAEGVFLWVRLVVRELLSGLGSSYSIQQLEEELAGLPQGLRALYQRMFAGIKGSDERRAARTLLLLTWSPRHDFGQHGVIVHSVVDELVDGTFNIDGLYAGKLGAPFMSGDVAERVRITSERLNNRCKGLVQIYTTQPGREWGASLGFIHRTVYDFFSEDTMQEELSLVAKSFEPAKFCTVALLRLLGSSFTTRKTPEAEGSEYEQGVKEYYRDNYTCVMSRFIYRILDLASDAAEPSTFRKELAATHSVMMKLFPGLEPNDSSVKRSMRISARGNVSDFQPEVSGRIFERPDELWLALCAVWELRDPISIRLSMCSDMVESELGAQILLYASLNAMGPLRRPRSSLNRLSVALLEQGFLPNGGLPSQYRLHGVGDVAPRLDRVLSNLPLQHWTVWTLLLHALTAVMHYGEPLWRPSGFFETFLKYGADPTVLFVGYRIVTKDFGADLMGPFYFDFRQLLESSDQPKKFAILSELDRKQHKSPREVVYGMLKAIWPQDVAETIPRIKTEVLRSSIFLTVAITTETDLPRFEVSRIDQWAGTPGAQHSIASM